MTSTAKRSGEVLTSDDRLRAASVRRLLGRAVTSGRIVVPAVPGMLEDYVEMCNRTFVAIGVHFTEAELHHLRSVIREQLEVAFARSPRSEIVITYDSPVGLSANYQVHAHWADLDVAYNNWVATREGSLFGTEPDARVLALALAAPDPADCPVLDIGAGTGRNAITLARRGHPVDVVEMTSQFAEIIRQGAERESLQMRILQRDVFVGTEDLRRDYGLIVMSEVASDFRDTAELRKTFELAAECLAPGGQLVFNVFVTRNGYVPDDAARALGQQCYTAMFTPEEITEAASELPLELVSDHSVHDYEREQLPATAWPPTHWYAGWVSGQDVFDVPREDSPIELRWLVYRKHD